MVFDDEPIVVDFESQPMIEVEAHVAPLRFGQGFVESLNKGFCFRLCVPCSRW